MAAIACAGTSAGGQQVKASLASDLVTAARGPLDQGSTKYREEKRRCVLLDACELPDDADGKLRIDQLAAQHGIERRDIERFEDLGFVRPNRDANGSFYSHSDEVRLRVILKARMLGFDNKLIAEILTVAKWG